MSVQDAIDTRAISQRIKRAWMPINQNFLNERALFKMTEKQIKWGGSHTEFDWFVRNVPTGKTATFGNPDGELSVLTFEELKPVNRARLPYCYLTKTYGVGERSIEANRNATDNKIFDIVKENLELAKIFMYDALGPSIYNGNISADDPVGLLAAVGSPINTSSNAIVAAGASYAGRTLTTLGIDGSTREGLVASDWDDKQWAPTVGAIEEVIGGTAKWSTHCFEALSSMVERMSRTASVSGTGTRIKPDVALMNTEPYTALKNRAVTNQVLYNTPLGRA